MAHNCLATSELSLVPYCSITLRSTILNSSARSDCIVKQWRKAPAPAGPALYLILFGTDDAPSKLRPQFFFPAFPFALASTFFFDIFFSCFPLRFQAFSNFALSFDIFFPVFLFDFRLSVTNLWYSPLFIEMYLLQITTHNNNNAKKKMHAHLRCKCKLWARGIDSI